MKKIIVSLANDSSFILYPDTEYYRKSFLIRKEEYESWDNFCDRLMAYLLSIKFFRITPNSTVASQSIVSIRHEDIQVE